MKKLNILLLSAVAMGSTLVSCSKDEAKPNISLSGKWTFSQLTVNSQTGNYPAGFSEASTQCSGIADYLNFTNSTSLNYGNNDKNSSGDCILTDMPMTYSTTSTTLTIKDLIDKGQDATFTVVKNTNTELQLQMTSNGSTYLYSLNKAQ